jgi:hypothetical protein
MFPPIGTLETYRGTPRSDGWTPIAAIDAFGPSGSNERKEVRMNHSERMFILVILLLVVVRAT